MAWLTINIVNIGTSKIIAVIILKFEQHGLAYNIVSENEEGMANSVNPDQTAPIYIYIYT